MDWKCLPFKILFPWEVKHKFKTSSVLAVWWKRNDWPVISHSKSSSIISGMSSLSDLKCLHNHSPLQIRIRNYPKNPQLFEIQVPSQSALMPLHFAVFSSPPFPGCFSQVIPGRRLFYMDHRRNVYTEWKFCPFPKDLL